MLELDWTLVINAINLIVLVFLLSKFLIKPVMKVIDDRQALVDDKFQNAAKAQKEASELKEQWEGCITDIEAHREAVLKESKEKAKSEYDKIIEKAEKDSQRIISDAREAIVAEKERTFREVENEIAGLAMVAAAKIIAENSDEKNNLKLYNQFITKVGDANESNSN